MSVITAIEGLKPSKRVLRLRPDRVLTMGQQERDDERPRGMLYRDPTVSAKCTYQNLKLPHVKVDVAKVGSWTSHVGFEIGLC